MISDLHKSLGQLSPAETTFPIVGAVTTEIDLVPRSRTSAGSSGDMASIRVTPSTGSGGIYLAPPSDVRICINDVTVDESLDTREAVAGGNNTDPELMVEGIKKQKRRSSWCPEEGRKKEEKQETQRMLAVTGRR